MSALTATAQPRLVSSRPEAEQLISEIQETMTALLAVLTAETKLVRATKLREAARLADDKARLVSAYADATATMRANADTLRQMVPDRVARLRQRHEAFREDLRLNMAVLSTAKAVSENLLRDVAQEMAAKDAPTGYAANGRIPAGRLAPARARPLAVNRAL